MTNETVKPCECCGEHPVSELGREHEYEYCEDCCKTTLCDKECGRLAEEHYLWETTFCESCQNKEERLGWLDETIEAIETAAYEHDWEKGDDHQAQTGTRYLTFSRNDETLKIRIADHGDCHCTADYSVAMPGKESGDDVFLQTVLDRLAQPAVESEEE